MILSDEEEGYNLRLRKWLIFHLYMCVLCSVKKKQNRSRCHLDILLNPNVCWHFVFKFGWLAFGQILFFSPPHTTLSCTCEFFMNPPSGLACGHNHFLLNPVSGTLFTNIKLFAIMQYGLHYSALWESCATTWIRI